MTQGPRNPGVTGRPNVLLVMADDMGWSDIGCYGGEIDTPNIDALAGRGVRMTQFYNTARCSPSRASLLTGLHPHQTGVGELVNDDGPGGYPGTLSGETATLAEIFAGAGYRTFLTGKWHLSNEREHPSGGWPTRRGFHRFWGTIAGAGSYFQPTTLHDGERPVDPGELGPDFHYTDAIGEHAAAAVREAAASGDPFFGYVAFTAPHWPLHARPSDTARFRDRYRAGWDELRHRRRERQIEAGLVAREATLETRDPAVPAWSAEQDRDWQVERMAVYAAQVHAMDRAFGAVLDALEDTGTREDTVVVFLSDNGGCAEELSAEPGSARAFARQHLIVPASAPGGGAMRIGNDPSIPPGGADTYTSYGRPWANLSNTPFRLYKRWVHEGGISTPLIVDWPGGELPGGSLVRAPHQLTDVLPTLLEATGVAVPDRVGGRAVVHPRGVSMLTALRGGPATGHDLYWEHIGNCAMRDGRWKLVREYGSPWELYDLDTDRSESTDLAAAEPGRVAAMTRRWQGWADSVGVRPREQVLDAQSRARAQPA